MSRNRFFLIQPVLALLTVCALVGSAQAAFIDDFESYASGDLPGQSLWIYSLGSTMDVVVGNGLGGSKAAETIGGNSAVMRPHWQAVTAGSQVTVDGYMYVPTSGECNFRITNLGTGGSFFAGNLAMDIWPSKPRIQLFSAGPGGEVSSANVGAGGVTGDQWFHVLLDWTAGGDVDWSVWDQGAALLGSGTLDTSTTITDPTVMTNIDIFGVGAGVRFDDVVTGPFPPPPPGVVMYSEDFEGGADPQSILAPPFSYSPAVTGSDMQVQSGSSLPTRAVDGSTGTGAQPVANTPIAGPDADTLTYSLTADLYAPSGSNDSGIGLSNSSISPYNDSGVYLMATAGGWRLDASGVMGTNARWNFPNVGMNEPVVGTILLDLVDKTVTGSIAYSGGILSHTYALPADLTNVMGIDRFTIQEIGAGRLDVDNVIIRRLVPEPSSMILAGLGGLMGLVLLGRRRRQ